VQRWVYKIKIKMLQGFKEPYVVSCHCWPMQKEFLQVLDAYVHPSLYIWMYCPVVWACFGMDIVLFQNPKFFFNNLFYFKSVVK
jgi:hypothetical protein